MATLSERLEAQIRDLQLERRRIQQQTVFDLNALDVKLGALLDARGIITADVEANFARLKSMGLLKEL